MGVTYEIRLQNADLSFDEDISADVQKTSWNRGRNSELDKAAAGACYVTVNNHDKKYSPENTGSPFYPYLQPKKLLLSIKATKNSTVYWQFKGRLEDITPTFTTKRKTAVLTAWDGLDELEKTAVRPELKESQKFGVLVGHVADEAGWPEALRDIDTGKDEVALWGPAEASAREDLKELEETEDGFVYIDHEGKLAAEDRDHRVGAVSQATFDNNMRQPRYRFGADAVLNEITCPVVPRWIEEHESYVWTLIDIASEDTPALEPPIIPAGEEVTFRANLEGMVKALQSPQPKLDYDAHANKEGTGDSLLDSAFNYLYVSADGDATETGAIFGQEPDSGAHWDKLDDTGEGKYLYAAEANCSGGWYDRHWCWGAELFQIDNLPGGVTRVSKLEVIAKVKTELQAGFRQLAHPIQIWIKTGGNTFKKEAGKAPEAWVNLTATWEVNPNTDLPWTPTEVNALQIGISLWRQTYDSIGYTQYQKCCALYGKVSTNPLEVTSWSAKARTADFTIKNWGGVAAHMTVLKLRGNKIIEEDELTASKPDAPSQSQTDYKKRTHNIQTKWISDLPTADNLCAAKLARHDAPRPEIAITLVNRTATLWEQILKLHISDAVTVICDALGITTPGKVYFIEHMDHVVTKAGNIHQCTYVLSDATGIAATTGKTPPAITDTTPPAMPTSFAAEPAYRALKLTWDANTEPDFDHYEIWTSDDGNLANAKLLQVARDNHWSDPIGASDTDRCYWIRAVDTHGNKSDLSPAAFGTTISELLDDLAVPGAPTGLVATGYLGGILLTWTSNTESDFDYYEIYRHTSDDSGAASLIAIARATAYVDPVGTGVLRYYWLKAVDRLGYTSDFSTGATTTSLKLVGGDVTDDSLTAALFKVGLQPWAADMSLAPKAADKHDSLTVGSGTIKFMDESTKAITGKDFDNLANGEHYIYFDMAQALPQETTDYTQVVLNETRGLLAMVYVSTDADNEIGIQPFFAKKPNIMSDFLAAKAVRADHIWVDNLAAINADLGAVTAGTITGLLIRTAASGDRIELSGTKLQVIKGGVVQLEIDGATGDVWMGAGADAKKLLWDSSESELSLILGSGSSGYDNLSDKPSALGDINADEGTKLTGIEAGADVTGAHQGDISLSNLLEKNTSSLAQVANYKLVSDTEKIGSARAYNGLDSTGRIKTYVVGAGLEDPSMAGKAAGLYFTASKMGYWNGSAWTLFFSSAGDGYFKGSIYASSIVAGNTLTVLGAISVASGAVILDGTGIKIAGENLKFYESGNLKGYLKGVAGGIMLNASSGFLHLYSDKEFKITCDEYVRITPGVLFDIELYLGAAKSMYPYWNSSNHLGASGHEWADVWTDALKTDRGMVTIPVHSGNPANPIEGDIYLDSADSKFKGYDGVAWRNFH